MTPGTFTYLTCHDGRLVRSVDPMGLRTDYEHDERGLVLSEVIGVGTPVATRRQYGCDRVGRLVRHVDGGGQVYLTEYDPWGRPAKLTAPTGAVTFLVWGAEDRLLELRVEGDPRDGGPSRVLRLERYAYDERGRQVAVRVASFRFDPGASVELVTRFTYDGDDLLVARESPRGAVLRHRYDGLGRLVRVEDALGNVETRSYDAAGELERVETTEVGVSGVTTRSEAFTYDARGRMTSSRSPSGALTVYTHDDRNELVARDEPLGVRHTFEIGLLGEVLREVRDAGGLALVTERSFDLLGRALAYRDPTGQQTRWLRDPLGRPVEMFLPDARTWRWRYDAGGRVVEEQTPSGTRLSFGYDAVTGLISSMSAVPGVGIAPIAAHSYAYDALGRLAEASAGGASLRRRYDGQGRLVEESTAGGIVARFHDDLAGTMELLYPDGRRERLEFDLHERPTRLTLVAPGALGGTPGDVLAELSYEGSARLAGVVCGNGVTSSFRYDVDRRLVSVRYDSGAGLVELGRYRYDARDRRRVGTLDGAPGRSVLASFDGDDRLVSARWGFALALNGEAWSQAEHDAAITATEAAAAAATDAESWGLDGSDTRTSVALTGGGPPFTAYASSPAHQLLAAGAETFAYNADGCLIRDALRVYDIDALGRVVRVRDAASTAVIAEFDYDALGRRSRLIRGGSTTLRHFLGDDWVQEDEGGVARQRTMHPLWHVPLLWRSSAGTRYLHADASLSVVAVSDESGSTVGRYRFRPFGEASAFDAAGAALGSSSVAGVPPLFGGMSWLQDARLYEATTRLYDPRHGVFLSPDPHLYADSPSPYVYAAHNPVDYVDPDGDLFWFVIGVIAVGAAVGAGSNAIRQGIQIAEGSRREFSWSEVGWSTLGGAVLAPAVVFAPEVTVPVLVGSGLASAADEYSRGNYATSTFDLVTSLLPLRSGPRGAAFRPSARWNGFGGRISRFEGLPRNRVIHVTTERGLTDSCRREALLTPRSATAPCRRPSGFPETR